MPSRSQTLYWLELTELKAGYEYARIYRDSLRLTLDRLSAARAIVSVAALGAWVTTHINPQIWASVIVLMQLAEAAERGLAGPARFAAISDLCAAFNALFIEARQEWEEIAASKRTEEQIRKAWGRLLDKRSQADHKAFPRGLPPRTRFKKLAKAEADAYFERQFPVDEA